LDASDCDRQRDRLTDTRGAPVGGDFEPFEPAVQRSDIRLESPVGAEEANHPLAVYNAKKLLSAAGFHDFAPGIEGIGEASPRFLADLRRFQAAHDLAPDAVAQPGGPSSIEELSRDKSICSTLFRCPAADCYSI